MVAGAERARDVALGDEAEAEAIAGGAMFGGVVLEVVPEMVGERVFRVRFRFEDAAELWAVGGKLRELEIPPLAEADEEDALAVLGDDALRVDDLVIDGLAEVLREGCGG